MFVRQSEHISIVLPSDLIIGKVKAWWVLDLGARGLALHVLPPQRQDVDAAAEEWQLALARAYVWADG